MLEKQTLLDDAESCRRKMNNATALIDGLAGERVRWTEASKNFASQIHRLVGDVLLACGFLSYSGPFNQDFRTLIMKGWKKELISNKIPFSDVSINMFFFNGTMNVKFCCIVNCFNLRLLQISNVLLYS